MNIIKNLFRSLANLISKEKFKKCYTGTRDYVLSLTFVKVTAIVVANCFLLTCVYGQGVAAVVDNGRTATQFKQIFDDFALPYSYGKITSANFMGSDTVVINIQDLHSHPEVQRNISNIISLFDEKYGVKNVYLEGAYGQVSTKWLTVAKDENVKKSVMNKLLDAGRLTGAEYFSASKNKTEIIKGLENKDEYFDNLKRFGQIIDNQNIINLHLDEINNTVKELQAKYYNRQQQKIEELSAQYNSGAIDAKKYFTLMKKHADKLGVDIDSYQNLSLYTTLLEKQKEINYQKTTQELQVLVVKLKEVLPYGAYKMLLEQTKNFAQMDKLYGYIIKLSKQYNFDLSVNFPELEKFFAYIELSQKINPLELVKEEQDFKDEINDRFSANKAEEEVVFLSSFVRYYRDYLIGKITADDCKYYNANIDRFKKVWVKYIDNKEVVALADYEAISDKFYKINSLRNDYFIENMKDVLDTNKISEKVSGNDELQKVMNSLQQAKDIYITVTGGFHTQNLSALLTKAGITNIVITPNVTGDTKVAEETYYKIAQEQAKISFQALAPLDASQAILAGDKDAIKDFLNAMLSTDNIKNVLDSNEIVKLLDINDNFLSVSVNGNSYRFIYDGKNGEWEQTGTELDNETSTQGQQKSVSSVKTALKAAAALTGISVLATFGIATFFTAGFFPIVVLLGAISTFGFVNTATLWKQIQTLKAVESDVDENSEGSFLLENLTNKLSDNTKNSLEKALGGVINEDNVISYADMKDDKLFEVDNGVLYINPVLFNKLFKDCEPGDPLLETFVQHEIAHINFPNIFIKGSFLEEIIVSFGDTRRFITSYVSKNISPRGPTSLELLSQKEREEYYNKSVDVLGKDLVEKFKDRQAEKYGPLAKNSDQTKNQIIMAAFVVNGQGGLVELGTGAGKDDAFALAEIYNYVNGRKTLYSTNTAELGHRFIEKTLIMMKELNVVEKGETFTLAYIHESDDSLNELWTIDSNGKITKGENKYSKSYLYEKADSVIGSSISEFIFSRQRDLENEEKTITQKKWFYIGDEIHKVLEQGANDTFLLSGEERKDAGKRAQQQLYAHELVKELKEGEDFIVKDKKIEIKKNRKNHICEEYKERSKEELDNETILMLVQNSLEARYLFKEGKDYILQEEKMPLRNEDVLRVRFVAGKMFNGEKITIADYKAIAKKYGISDFELRDDEEIKKALSETENEILKLKTEKKDEASFIKDALDNAQENNSLFRVKLLDKTTTEMTAKTMEEKQLALELYKAEGNKDRISFSYSRNAGSRMSINAFLNDNDVLEGWGGASGTLDSNIEKELYNRDVLKLGSQGGAVSSEMYRTITSGSEKSGSEKSGRENQNKIFNDISDKLDVMGNNMRLVKANNVAHVEELQKEFENKGKPVYVIIDNGEELPEVEINGIKYQPSSIEEALMYLSFIPNMTVISTAFIATGTDPKPLSAIVFNESEVSDKDSEDYITIELTEDKSTIEKAITKDQLDKVVKDGKKIILRGRTKQDLLNKGQLVDTLVGINLSWDIDGKIEEQFRARVGRSNTKGMYISILNIEDIDEDEMTEEDIALLREQVENIENIKGIENKYREIFMLEEMCNNAGVEPNSRELAFAEAMMKMQGNIINDSYIPEEGPISNYGKNRSPSRKAVEAIDRIRRNDAQSKLSSTKMVQRQAEEEWNFIKTQKEYIQSLSDPKQFFKNNETDMETVINSLNTNSNLRKQFTERLKNFNFNSNNELGNKMSNLVKKLESNENITQEDIQTLFEFAMYYYQERYKNVWTAYNDSKRNLGFTFQDGFNQVFFQTASLDQDSEITGVFAGVTDNFEGRIFDELGLSLLIDKEYKSDSKSIYKVFGTLGKFSNLAIIGLFSSVFASLSALSIFTAVGVALTPLTLGIAAIVFLLIIASISLKPLTNKINADLQDRGINSSLSKIAITGNSKYLKDSAIAMFTRAFSSTVQINTIASIIMLGLGITLGISSLITLALIAALTTVAAMALLIVFSSKYSQKESKSVIGYVTDIKNYIKDVAKRKIVSNTVQTKTNIITNTVVFGISVLALFSLPLTYIWTVPVAIGMLLFAQYGVPSLIYNDKDSISSKTLKRTALPTLAVIIPAFILVKMGILSFSVISVFIGAMIPAMVIIGIIGAVMYYKTSNFVDKPLIENDAKNKNLTDKAKSLVRIVVPVLSIVLVSAITIVAKGAAVSIFSIVSPVSLVIGGVIAVIFIALLYNEKTRPYAQLLLALIGFATMLSGTSQKTEQYVEVAESTVGGGLIDSLLPGAVSATSTSEEDVITEVPVTEETAVQETETQQSETPVEEDNAPATNATATESKYDADGYDKDGYDREGYDRQGYNRAGYNRAGYDKDGYDKDGFNKDGVDRQGNKKDETKEPVETEDEDKQQEKQSILSKITSPLRNRASAKTPEEAINEIKAPDYKISYIDKYEGKTKETTWADLTNEQDGVWNKDEIDNIIISAITDENGNLKDDYKDIISDLASQNIFQKENKEYVKNVEKQIGNDYKVNKKIEKINGEYVLYFEVTDKETGKSLDVWPYSIDGNRVYEKDGVVKTEDVNHIIDTWNKLDPSENKKYDSVEGKLDEKGDFFFEIKDKNGHIIPIYPFNENGYDENSAETAQKVSDAWNDLEKNGNKVTYNKNNGSFTVTDNKGHSVPVTPNKDGNYNTANVQKTLDAWNKLDNGKNEVTYNSKDGSFTVTDKKNKNHKVPVTPDKDGNYNTANVQKTFEEWDKVEAGADHFKVVSAKDGMLKIKTSDGRQFSVDPNSDKYTTDGTCKIYNTYSLLVEKYGKGNVDIRYNDNGDMYYMINGREAWPFDRSGKWNFNINDPFGENSGNGNGYSGGGVWNNFYNSVVGYVAPNVVNDGKIDINGEDIKKPDYSSYGVKTSWLPESLSFIEDFFNNLIIGIKNMLAFIWEAIFGPEQTVSDSLGKGPCALLKRLSVNFSNMKEDDIAEFEKFDMMEEYFKDLKGYDKYGNETTDTSKIVEYKNGDVIWKKEIVDGNEIWFCYENNNGETGNKLMMLQEEPVEEGSSQTQYVFRSLKDEDIKVDTSDGLDESHQYSKLAPNAYASDTTITLQSYDNGEDNKLVDTRTSVPENKAMFDIISGSFIYDSQDFENVRNKFINDPQLCELITENVEGFGEDNPFGPIKVGENEYTLSKDSMDFIETFLTTNKYDEVGNPYVNVLINGEPYSYPMVDRDDKGVYILKDGEKVFVKKENYLGFTMGASDILKQSSDEKDYTGINQLKSVLKFYSNLDDEGVDNFNTIYCTLNLDTQKSGTNQLYIRPNIQHHDKGLTSDNIRILFQCVYTSKRSDNGNMYFESEPMNGIEKGMMSPEKINNLSDGMVESFNYELNFVERMMAYKYSLGIFDIPGTDLLQLANIQIPENLFDTKDVRVIISNEAWNTIREQGLTNKGKNTWVYGQEFDAGMFFNFLFKDTGPDKFIAEHTHSALISFGGYFYLFVGSVIGYRALKRIVKGLKKIKGFFTNKVGGDDDDLSSKNIYEKIDDLRLEGTTIEEKIKNIEANYPEIYEYVISENKKLIENEIKEKTKGSDTEESLNNAIKQVFKNEVKDAQFYALKNEFSGKEDLSKNDWNEGLIKLIGEKDKIGEIVGTVVEYEKDKKIPVLSDDHVRLLQRMIDTDLVTLKNLQDAFKNVDETKTGEIGPMNQVVEILLGKAVENEYEKIAKYLPVGINNDTVKNHILELRGRLYSQLLEEPGLIQNNGNIINGANRNVAIQMSQQNLREMIVANILMLRPSLTEKMSLGSDTITSTLNLTRLILSDIDSGNASPQKTEKRIRDFIAYTKHFVEFNSLFKQLSTEPSDPTNVEWLEQVEESNFYKDTDHINLFMFLNTDQIIYEDRNIKDIDIFNLTKEDLETQFKVKGEDVTLFGNVLELGDFKQIKNEDGTLNLIASINNYLEKNDDTNNEVYFAFGKAINEDIKNIERILEGDSELSRYEEFATTQQEKAIDRAINGRTFRGTKIGSNSIFDNCHMEVNDYSYNKGSAKLFNLLNKNGIISKDDVKIELDLGEVMREYVLNKKDGKEPNLQTKRIRITNLRTAIQNDLDNNKIIDNKDSAEAMIKGLENLETNYGQTFFLRFLNGLSVYKRFLKDIAGFSFWNIETRQQKIATYLLMGVFASLIMAVFLFATPIGASLVPVIAGALGKTVIGNMLLTIGTNITGAVLSVIGSSAAGSSALSFMSGVIGVANYDIIMTLIVSGLLLPKMIVGRATDGDMKRNILGIMTAFSVYYGGFLGGFFIRGIAISLFPGAFPIFAILTIGISFAVWLFIGIPTFASFWHIMIGTKSNKIEREKNKILTAHNDMEKRISWQKRATLAFGIGGVAGIGWLTSLIFSFLVTPIAPPFMLMTLGILIVFFIAGGIMSLWSYRYVGNTDKKENFGKVHIRDVYELYEQSDNPEMLMSDIRANIEIAYNRDWIGRNERKNILEAYRKIEEAVRSGKSVKEIEKEIEKEIGIENLSPKKVEIREMLKQYFLACSVEKATIPDWSKIPAIEEHTQAYSEQGRWTIADILARGDFHKGTSQFARLASQLKESFWANSCEKIDNIVADNITDLSKEEKEAILSLVSVLKNIEETSEIQTIEELGLKSKEAKELYNKILGVACNFMESTLGSQQTVAETKYEDHVQLHKTLALDQGDIRYAKLVNKIRVVYDTLDEAIADYDRWEEEYKEWEKNGKNGPEPQMSEKIKIVSDTINSNDEFDNRKITTEDFEYFVKKFKIYAPEVRKKHKMAITDFSLYQEADIVTESRDYRIDLSFEDAMLSDSELDQRKNEIIEAKEKGILEKKLQERKYAGNKSKSDMLGIIAEVDELCKDFSNAVDGKINYKGDMEGKIDDVFKAKKYSELTETEKNIIKEMVIKRRAFHKLSRHALNLLALGDKYDIVINYIHPNDETALRGNKNAQLRTALSAPETGFIGTSVLIERDAFCSNALGQSQFVVNAVMDFENNGYLCLNLPMQAKGSSLTGDDGKPVFPVGKSYAGAIRDWTQGTQSAYDPNLTYYGKGIIRSEGMIAIGWTNPGEDSNSVYINFKAYSLGNQGYQARGIEKNTNVEDIIKYIDDKRPETTNLVGYELADSKGVIENLKQAIAGYLQYFRLDWIRPTTTNVVGSEARYSSNVFRMLYDPFSTIYEKTNSAGYDWKLSNIMMAAHYINSILTVIFALFLPLAVIFSSFAFLMPFMLSFAVSTVLMLAINLTKINAEARQKGDFFVSIKESLKDIIRYFPFWVAMQPVMALFGINASNGVYKFLSTYKDMKLQQDRNVKGVYEFVGSVGAKIGTAGYILTGLYIMLVGAFTLSNPLSFGIWLGVTKAVLGIVGAILVSSFYILANTAFINGLNSYNVRLDENGKVTGRQIRDTVYIPAAKSIYKAPFLFFHYIWDLILILGNKEPKYLNKMNAELDEKEQAINNTDISLKMIYDMLNKEDRTADEQAVVDLLIKKYEMSEENLKKNIGELKDKTSVEDGEKISPAGKEMKEIAGFLRDEIGIDVNGDEIKGRTINKELLEQVKKALDIDIRNSFDYNLNKGYENFLEISKNFLHKHPAIKAIFRPVITGVTVAGAFSIISTAIMSFTTFSSTVAPMTVTIFIVIATIWSLYNLGSALAKKNGSKYLKLFSFVTWAGIPAIAFFFMSIPLMTCGLFAAVLAIPLIIGYLLQKNNIRNTEKEFETKFGEIKEDEFKLLVEKKIENKIRNNNYTIEVIEKDFDRVVRENFDEALVEFIEKENMKSELSELYNDIETASNARISFFLQQTFNETIGGENGLTNSIVNSIKANKFMNLFEKSDEDKDNDEDNGDNIVEPVKVVQSKKESEKSIKETKEEVKTEIEIVQPKQVEFVEKKTEKIEEKSIEETQSKQETPKIEEPIIEEQEEKTPEFQNLTLDEKIELLKEFAESKGYTIYDDVDDYLNSDGVIIKNKPIFRNQFRNQLMGLEKSYGEKENLLNDAIDASSREILKAWDRINKSLNLDPEKDEKTIDFIHKLQKETEMSYKDIASFLFDSFRSTVVHPADGMSGPWFSYELDIEELKETLKILSDIENSAEIFKNLYESNKKLSKKTIDEATLDETAAEEIIPEPVKEDNEVVEEAPVEEEISESKSTVAPIEEVSVEKESNKPTVTATEVAAKETTKTAGLATGSIEGKWAVSFFLNDQGNIEMRNEIIEGNYQNSMKLTSVPGIFVSKQDIENMKKKGLIVEENEEDVLKDKNGEIVAKLNDKEQLVDINGNLITLKYNAVTLEQNGKTIIQFRPFNINSDSAKIFECLDAETQNSLTNMAAEALSDRLVYDKVLEQKLIGKNTQNKNDVTALMTAFKKSAEKKNKNYSDNEKFSILNTRVIVSHSGMKSVDVEMKNKNSFITVCINAKKAGNDEIVLITSKEDKVITRDEVKYVAEQAFTYGLRASVEINSANIGDIDSYFGIDHVSGFRFANEELYNSSSELVKKIQEAGKEVSVKVANINESNDKIDWNGNAKTVYVIDTSNCNFENETLIETLKDLAENGRVKLYYDNDKEVTEEQQKQVEKVFGKSAKTMIALGKSFITNKFASLFNTNPVAKYFTKGLNTDFRDMFSGRDSLVVPELLPLLSDKNFTIKDFDNLYINNESSIIFSPEMLDIIDYIKNDKSIEADDKIPAIRQFVIGTLINYVESELPNKLEQNSELKNVEFSTLNKTAMEQVEYRIMQLLMSGKSLENIVTEVAEQQVSSNKSFAEILNEAYDSEIASEWIKTDMLIKPISDSNVAEVEGAIKALLMDSIKVDSIMEDTLSVGIEGIADILAAA